MVDEEYGDRIWAKVPTENHSYRNGERFTFCPTCQASWYTARKRLGIADCWCCGEDLEVPMVKIW